MQKAFRKAKCITLQLLWNAHIEVMDLFLAWIMFIWGFWVLLPFTTFELGSFAVFSRIFPEPVWGIIYMLIGLFGLVAVLTYNYNLRRLHSVLAIFLWVLLAGSFVMSTTATTGIVTYGSLAIAQMWLYVRQKFTAKKEFVKFKGNEAIGTVNNFGGCIDGD